jgi:hypothetical protein
MKTQFYVSCGGLNKEHPNTVFYEIYYVTCCALLRRSGIVTADFFDAIRILISSLFEILSF